MRHIAAIIAAIFSLASLQAQQPSALPTGMPAPPSNGRIFGRLVDSTGKGLGGLNLTLFLQRHDSATGKTKAILVKSATTKSNGDFNIESVPVSAGLTLECSGTGFKTLSAPSGFILAMPKAEPAKPGSIPAFPNMEKDMGRIVMQADVQELKAVVVTAPLKGLRLDIDRKVFPVEQNLVSAGGTAVDVMRNVPSVNVDIDGNVSLRNASPQIYVDGRPTTLSLDQIPADAIESVEVITNPSSKFDASGGNAGILNIVLKKNRKTGYNGTVNAGVDKRGGLNGGANASLRQDRFNISVSTFGNQMKNRSTGSTIMHNILQGEDLLVAQDSRTRMNGGFLFGRLGADYFATNRLTLSAGVVKVRGSFNPSEIMTADSSHENGKVISHSVRTAANDRNFNAYGAQGGFKYIFPREGEELTGDINLFSGRHSASSLYNTDIYSTAGGPMSGNVIQQVLGAGSNRFLTLQTDYARPVGTGGKFETGARIQLRNISNAQYNSLFDAGSGKFVKAGTTGTNYRNRDNVYAAYASLKGSLGELGYMAGLRAESSDYLGEMTDAGQRFTNRYPLSIFPSLFLSRKLGSDRELQLSYSRRVNRPFFMQLIPFIDSTDRLNWSRGNAGLRPEFTQSMEMSFTRNLKGGNSLLASVYYKHSTDLITRMLDTVAIGGQSHPVISYANADASHAAGIEFTAQLKPVKWWDVNANLNLYRSRILTDGRANVSPEAMWSAFAKTNSNLKLPKNFKIQISTTWQSRTNLPVNNGGGMGPGAPPMAGSMSAAQGYIRSSWGLDLAVQKSFLKNNAANVTLGVSDIFRTRRMDQYSASPFFTQDVHRMPDVPMVRLNLSWKFGQMDLSLFKRKNMKAEGEGPQNAMQGIQ